MLSDDRVSLEELIGVKLNKSHKELVNEEIRLRAKQPPHWASSVFRIRALKLAKAKGEITEKEYQKELTRLYKERKNREKTLKEKAMGGN